MPKDTQQGRRARLKQYHYAAADDLQRIESGTLETVRAHRSGVRKYLNRLAKAAGIPKDGLADGELYLTAMRTLAGTGSGEDHADAERLRDVIERVRGMNELRRACLAAAEATPAAESSGFILELTLGIYGICGFVPGEEVDVTEVAALKPWDIGAVMVRDDDNIYVGRVVSFDDEGVILRDDQRDEHFQRDDVTFIGRINPEPVGRVDGLTAEEAERWKSLKARLDALDADDITSSTARLALEGQIYDLEHPRETGDEWPEYLGGEGESR